MRFATTVYEFGPFRLDPVEKVLLRDGAAVHLTPKVFNLLLLLVENNGRLIDRPALLKQLWTDAFVEEGNLSKAMFHLRQALGQAGHDGPYIETLSKRGYRFVSQVREAHVTAPQPASLAVLAFHDLSPDRDQGYFCEGIAEELINALAQIPGLRVASRSSSFQFAGALADVREVGRELHVVLVLEGSVRKSAGHLRITIQLVQALDGFQLWSRCFDRQEGDIFEIQEEIAAAIVDSVAPNLVTGAPFTRPSTAVPEAYQLYLQGRYFWNRRPGVVVQKALECFRRALELDSNFAAAYAGIADVYATLGSWEAGVLPPIEALLASRDAAEKALSIDPSLAEAHACLAYAAQHFEWNLGKAEALFRKAIDLNPSYTCSRHWHSHCLVAAGRFEDSLAESRQALALDPLDLVLNFHLAWHYQMARQADQVIESASRVIQMDPKLHWGHYFLGSGYELKGAYTEAIGALHKACAVSSDNPVMKAWLGHSLALGGERRQALGIANEILALGETRGHFAYEAALIHAVLGDTDRAFDLLNRAKLQRSGWMSYVLVDPRLDLLRGDSRFPQLVAAIGLTRLALSPA